MQFPLLYDPEHSYTIISKIFSSIYDGVRVFYELCKAFIIL